MYSASTKWVVQREASSPARGFFSRIISVFLRFSSFFRLFSNSFWSKINLISIFFY